jgi:hypothetical protein
LKLIPDFQQTMTVTMTMTQILGFTANYSVLKVFPGQDRHKHLHKEHSSTVGSDKQLSQCRQVQFPVAGVLDKPYSQLSPLSGVAVQAR